MAISTVAQAANGHRSGGYPPASIHQEDHLHGFTPRQAEMAFRRIASLSHNLAWLLEAVANRLEEDGVGGTHANEVYCATAIADSIGAISDQLCGKGIVGAFETWLIDRQFPEAGKEGGAA